MAAHIAIPYHIFHQDSNNTNGDGKHLEEREFGDTIREVLVHFMFFLVTAILSCERSNAFRASFYNTCVNNSYRIGLALFALGVIAFFGQRYVLGFFALLASTLAPGSGAYQIVLQSFYVVYLIALIMIISGAVMFYKGRRETSNLTPSAHPEW